jgi:hypothetical protein
MICRISGANMTKRARRNHTSVFKAKVVTAYMSKISRLTRSEKKKLRLAGDSFFVEA